MASHASLSGEMAHVFADSHTWLRRQPGMRPLDHGLAMLTEQLHQWVAEYSTGLCENLVTTSQDSYVTYARRLWTCWSYHWKQAIAGAPRGRIDGDKVACQIRAGCGYHRGGRLGGDPLHDVVLAVAMTYKDNRATAQFEKEYYGFARTPAGKVHHPFSEGPDEGGWGVLPPLLG